MKVNIINTNNNEYLIGRTHGEQQHTVKLRFNVTIKDVAYRDAKEQNHSPDDVYLNSLCTCLGTPRWRY